MNVSEHLKTLAEKISDAFYQTESNEVTVPVTPTEANTCFYPDSTEVGDNFAEYLEREWRLVITQFCIDYTKGTLTTTLEETEEFKDDCDDVCDDECPF